jgi:hypothetical protein
MEARASLHENVEHTVPSYLESLVTNNEFQKQNL